MTNKTYFSGTSGTSSHGSGSIGGRARDHHAGGTHGSGQSHGGYQFGDYNIPPFMGDRDDHLGDREDGLQVYDGTRGSHGGGSHGGGSHGGGSHGGGSHGGGSHGGGSHGGGSHGGGSHGGGSHGGGSHGGGSHGGGNQNPDAVDDTAATAEDTSVNIAVLANDSDPDGDPLTVTTATSPDGTVTIESDGTLTFEPAADFNGPTTISYTVSDGNGGTDTAVVDVDVTPVNDDPVANDDTAATAEDTPVNIDVLANDSDVDGDPLTVTAATSPHGSVTVEPDGTLTFEPDTGFTGPTTIDYTITDGNGGSDTATVDVTVGTGGGNNHDPDAVDDEGNTHIDTSVTIAVLANDSDPDGDPLTVIDASSPNGSTTINPDGTITFDPQTGYHGDATLSYTVSDGNGGTDTADVTVHVNDGIVEGTNGDDLIDYNYTGDPDGDMVDHLDEFLPGEGPNDDIIQAYGGDDVIYAGLGNDDVSGGDGSDTVYGQEGDDIIDGGNGADEIHGGDGVDTITGGQGEDQIYGDDGADIIDGGDGDDEIYGGRGKDEIHGGQGDDYIDGQTGEDIIYGDEGDDTIIGTTGADMLYGGSGNDEISAGNNDDFVDGGTGDDVIHGGEGADTLLGGDDQDYFDQVTVGDTVQGNAGGVDFDTLDLTGSAPIGGSLTVTATGPDSDGNGIDGYVTYTDADGNNLGTLDFYNIEKVIPCFTPGTLIATPKGERRVEELEPGDRVITRDNGIQELKWVGHKPVAFRELAMADHLKPVLIRQGALGNGLPERDMMVSPNHRVLVANDRTTLYFDEREVLAAAKHLVDNNGITVVEPMGITYVHFMFEHHEVVLSDGAWTESFQPGDHSLKGIGNAQRQELFELFPELETEEGIEDYAAARRILKKHEARMLLKE